MEGGMKERKRRGEGDEAKEEREQEGKEMK